MATAAATQDAVSRCQQAIASARAEAQQRVAQEYDNYAELVRQDCRELPYADLLDARRIQNALTCERELGALQHALFLLQTRYGRLAGDAPARADAAAYEDASLSPAVRRYVEEFEQAASVLIDQTRTRLIDAIRFEANALRERLCAPGVPADVCRTQVALFEHAAAAMLTDAMAPHVTRAEQADDASHAAAAAAADRDLRLKINELDIGDAFKGATALDETAAVLRQYDEALAFQWQNVASLMQDEAADAREDYAAACSARNPGAAAVCWADALRLERTLTETLVAHHLLSRNALEALQGQDADSAAGAMTPEMREAIARFAETLQDQVALFERWLRQARAAYVRHTFAMCTALPRERTALWQSAAFCERQARHVREHIDRVNETRERALGEPAKTPLQMPQQPLVMPNPPLQMPKPPLQMPKPPLAMPAPPLQMPKPPLVLPTPPLQMPKPPLVLPTPPLQVPKPPLAMPAPPLQMPKPPVVPPTPPLVPQPPARLPPQTPQAPPSQPPSTPAPSVGGRPAFVQVQDKYRLTLSSNAYPVRGNSTIMLPFLFALLSNDAGLHARACVPAGKGPPEQNLARRFSEDFDLGPNNAGMMTVVQIAKQDVVQPSHKWTEHQRQGQRYVLNVSAELANGLRACAADPRRRFIVLLLAFQPLKGPGHQNAFIVDLRERTLERIEPNGGGVYYQTELLNWYSRFFAQRLLSPLGRGNFRYLPPRDVCPNLGPQALEAHSSNGGGYCVAWSVFVLLARILNPDYSTREVQEKIVEGRSKTYLKFLIRAFLDFVDRTLADAKIENAWQGNAAFRKIRSASPEAPFKGY